MNRRDLFQWAGASGLATAWTPGAASARQDESWQFTLDGRQRWTLDRPRTAPIVRAAEIAIALDDRPPVALADHADLRRFRASVKRRGIWTVVGHLGDVETTVQLEDGPSPVVRVSVRGLGARHTLRAVHFTGGVRVSQAQVWLNGYQSWDACRVASLGDDRRHTGWWQLALRGGTRGLAFAFGESDAASGTFILEGRDLDAAAEFDARPVGVDLPPAVCSLTVLGADEPLEALGDDAAARIAALRFPALAGWCSWYELYADVSEDDVVTNLEFARTHFDPRAFRVIQLDDGFQRAAGDWEMNGKFPHGHRWLTDRIRAAGFRAGLWLAPFAVTERSGLPAAHPDWLLLGPDGAPLSMGRQPHWGGQVWGLDASRRDVQDWLRALTRRAVTEWGYDYLKLDFLYYGARGGRPERRVNGAEALRAGLRALREGALDAYLLGCGAPLQPSLGLFDAMRIGGDVNASWDGVLPGATAALLRAHLQGRAWRNDPDALVVRSPLTLAEAQTWTAVVALSGGMTLASDVLPRLDAERVDLLQRAMPPAPVRARVLDLEPAAPPLAPALMAGERRLVPLAGPWRFRAGDDPAWRHPALDDTGWEPIEVGVPWEQEGHDGLDGYAWYRVHFTAPLRPPSEPLALLLGRIDDVDETFVNGARVGETGSPPPRYRADWQAFRRYEVPARAVRWGEDNVVAVRVYDGGGAGGLWSLQRERPPGWVLTQAREDWWTLAAINWDDIPRRLATDLAAHGLRGPLAAYDVWTEARLTDVTRRVQLAVAPHHTGLLGLRRPRRHPFVLGSTRHLVQGVIDIAEEVWTPGARTLRGRSSMLDGRPYRLALALPPGYRARGCDGDAGCRIESAARGAVRLAFDGTRDDVGWEVFF